MPKREYSLMAVGATTSWPVPLNCGQAAQAAFAELPRRVTFDGAACFSRPLEASAS
jgi:hypothetical protein